MATDGSSSSDGLSLYDLVPCLLDDDLYSSQVDWVAVIARAKSHPKEARNSYPIDDENVFKSEQSWPLHEIVRCRGAPVAAVSAVMNAYPRALITPTDVDEYPIMIALDADVFEPTTSTTIIRLLAKETVYQLRQDGHDSPSEWTPFEDIANCHCGRLSLHAVRIVLEEYPCLLDNEHHPGGIPGKIWGTIANFIYGNRNNAFDAICAGRARCLRKRLWDTLQLLLETRYPTLEGYPQSPLHKIFAALLDNNVLTPSCRGPIKYEEGTLGSTALANILNEFRIRHPEAFSLRNHRGYLPLHSFLSMERNLYPPTDGCVGLILKPFLEAYPEALAEIDCEGHLPLYHAIEGTWPVDELVQREPRALATRDLSSHCYPYQTALLTFAEASRTHEPDCALILQALQNAYLLIQEEPSLIAFLCKRDGAR